MTSDDYQRGYAAGYGAKRRAGQPKGKSGPTTYRRQHWQCLACNRAGMVLLRHDDNAAVQEWRMRQSHSAGRRGGCRTPQIVRVSVTGGNHVTTESSGRDGQSEAQKSSSQSVTNLALRQET